MSLFKRYTKIFILIPLVILCDLVYANAAPAYQYQKQLIDNQVVHIVSLNPALYDIQIIKSNNGAPGRETVPDMAKRTSAEIAINGGFFEIGGTRDGMPTGTLVINGKSYKTKNHTQALMIIDNNQISIRAANPKQLNIKNASVISGIPLLVHKGEIVPTLSNKTKDFYTKGHARTAVGKKADGTIVVVVAEHNYLRDLASVTMDEIQSLVKEKGETFTQQYGHKDPGDLTFQQLKDIVKQEFTSAEKPQGMTIMALAKLMKAHHCQEALNLDGGGSSTLWIDGKVVNLTMGDVDESNGMQTIRPVSDAIVFKRK